MKIISKITGGTRADGKPDPLVHVGEWDFEGRRLTTIERAFILALRDAHLVEIIEDDEPMADVLPIAPARAQHEKRIAAAVSALNPVAARAATEPRKRAKKKRVSRS